jgi:hypothetical protein
VTETTPASVQQTYLQGSVFLTSVVTGAAAVLAGTLHVPDESFAAPFYPRLSPELLNGRIISGELAAVVAGLSSYFLFGRTAVGAIPGIALGGLASYGIGAGDLPFGMSGLGFSHVSAIADSWFPKSWTNAYMIEELNALGISPHDPLVQEVVIEHFDRDYTAVMERPLGVSEEDSRTLAAYIAARTEYLAATADVETFVWEHGHSDPSPETKDQFEAKLARARAAADAYIKAGNNVNGLARGEITA